MTGSARMQRAIGIATAVVVAVMGVVLVATAWRTQRQVETASGLLLRGQAGLWYDVVSPAVSNGRAPSAATLQALIEANADNGLRYVAVVDARGRIVVAAGALDAALPSIDVATAETGEPARIGNHARVVFRGPPRRRRARADGTARPTGAPVPQLVIEFVDDASAQLRTSARSTLIAGGLAALGCFTAAALLLRWLRRREGQALATAHAQRLASLGQMSATMAHELRNPLASLKGNAQLLARMLPDGDRSRAKAEVVVNEAVRLESLTNDLLEFARTGMLARRPVAPAEVLIAAARDVDAQRIIVDSQAAPASWSLDAGRMRQVLANLLRNALEATPDRATKVAASVRRVGKSLQMTVRDHGAGIAPGDREHIFEPFVSKRAHGTGLGLAVARRLVELHGGTLTADNAPGGGAVFTVNIPA